MEIIEKAFEWDNNLTKLSYAGTKLAELIRVDTGAGILYKIKYADGSESTNLLNKTRAIELLNTTRHMLVRHAGEADAIAGVRP